MYIPYNKKKKKATRKCIILGKAAEAVKRKLKNSPLWIISKTEDGSIYKCPASIWGNKTYAYYQSKGLMEIQQKINELYSSDGKRVTNSLFITLTTRYNPWEEADSINSWRIMKTALSKFTKGIKKFGVREYIVGIESYRAGGCHAHVQVMLDRLVGMELIKDKYRIRDGTLRKGIKELWAHCLGCPLKEAHSDIQAVHSKELAGYITKELKKASSCEEALKRYDQGKATEKDEQKILVFYLAGLEKMRLLRVSRGLGSGKEEGSIHKDDTDLIIYSNKLSKVRIIVMRSQLVKLLKWQDISPYSGKIERGMAEYQVYKKLFEEREKIVKWGVTSGDKNVILYQTAGWNEANGV